MFKIALFVFLFGIVIAIVATVMTDNSGKKVYQQNEEKKRTVAEKFSAPYDYDKDFAFCVEGASIFEKDRGYGVWKKDSVLCFLNTINPNLWNENYHEIPIKDIVYYRCYGEEHYYSETFGGGGGGSSLGGAVVGGILGGATGAVIGSRRNVDDVQTRVRHINTKQTYLIINKNGQECTVVFEGDNMYKSFIKLIPAKSFECVNSSTVNKDAISNSDKKHTKIEDTTKKLKTLKNLADNGLISSVEYEEKKKEILSEL